MVLPEKLKPNTVDALVETVKPLAFAVPPEEPIKFTPVTLNWNPATSTPLVIIISMLPSETLSKDN